MGDVRSASGPGQLGGSEFLLWTRFANRSTERKSNGASFFFFFKVQPTGYFYDSSSNFLHKVKEKMKVSLCTGPHLFKLLPDNVSVRISCEVCHLLYRFSKIIQHSLLHRAFSPNNLAEPFVHCEVYFILFIGSRWFIEQMHWNMTSFWIVRFFLVVVFCLFFLSWGEMLARSPVHGSVFF